MNDASNWIRKPIAPPSHVSYAHGRGRGALTFEQVDELVKAINPAYVETKQRLTYLAQHQARAEMNRIFGYGNWDVEAEEPVMLYEKQILPGDAQYPKTGKAAEYWVVAYRIRVTAHIRDLWGMPIASFTGVHAEENAPQPNRGEAHALALTSVDSYALRRALINMGDRFGLGLYDAGSTAPHGQYTIQQSPGQLFNWEALGAEGAPATPPPANMAPNPTPEATSPPPAQSELQVNQQKLQADRQEWKDRIQEGMKLDEQVADSE